MLQKEITSSGPHHPHVTELKKIVFEIFVCAHMSGEKS